MRSSTSSFDRPLWVIAAAGVIAVILAVGWDRFWRGRGFSPAVVDDVHLWGIQRRRADSDDRVVALAGSSRFVMGLDLKVLGAALPGKKVVQLAIDGGTPVAILRNLADDEAFRGQVICEVLPHKTYTMVDWKELWGQDIDVPWSERLEAPLHVYISERTVLPLPDLTLNNVIKQWMGKRHLPLPGYWHLDRNRQGRNDFSHVDLVPIRAYTRHEAATFNTPAEGAEWHRRIAEIRQLAEKIRGRGGDVLFFRMISSTPVREVEDARFPDPVYWDVFCREVGFPCLHYREVSGLDQFGCPDGSHLDQTDVPAFTALFGAELTRRRLMR